MTVEKARDDEAKKLALENKKLLQQVEKLKGQLRASVVAKQHAVHEAELRVTDHFRKKLAAAAKNEKRDPLKTRRVRCPTPRLRPSAHSAGKVPAGAGRAPVRQPRGGRAARRRAARR